MKENQDVIDRILSFCVEQGYSQSEFAKALGMEQKTVNNYLNRSRKVSFEFVDNVVSTFGLNANWLLSGDTNWFEKMKTTKKVSRSDNASNKSLYPSKPFIDSAYAMCGLPSGFSLAVKADECEKVSLPLMIDYDFSIRGKGDSMLNFENPEHSIKAGDFIACKLWTSRTHLRWGEVYTLATRDGVVVKKIMPSEKEGHIKCVSFNERDGYLPYDLSIEEINDWAIVVGIVSVNKWN